MYDEDDYDTEDTPVFEVYTFEESTGSERVHSFSTQKAADEFRNRQPDHKMAH